MHVVEVDQRLREGLARELAPFANVSLHIADAVQLDLSTLDPAPTKVVANLPYGVAATVILRTIAELPGVRQWVVMVQREVGERFAAAPATAAYGVPSVLAQLACEVKVLRPVSRQVFRPVPNVDSVLLGLRRRGPGADPAVTRLVHAAFAHRRKALAGSLALAPGTEASGRACGSGRARRWSSSATPPTSAPSAWRPRSSASWRHASAHDRSRARARAGQDQPVPVPGADARRRAPRARDAVRCGLAVRRARGRRPPRSDEVVCEGVDGPNLVADALSALRDAGWDGAPGEGRPSPSGSPSRPAWVAARPTRRRSCASHPGWVTRTEHRACGSPDGLAPTFPASSSRARGSASARVTRLLPAPALSPYGVVVVPQPFPLSTADVYREADRLGLSRSPGGAATPCAPGSPVVLARADRQRPGAGGAVAGAPAGRDARRGPARRRRRRDRLRLGPDGDRAVLGRRRRVTRARGRASRLRGEHPAVLTADPVRGGDGARRRTNERLAAFCAGSEPSTPVMTTFRHNHGCET